MGNNLSNFDIIRVTPTLDTNAYAVDDVLFTGVEIPNAVMGNGGCSVLKHMFVVDRADSGDIDIDFYFTEKNTAFGTQNATADISAANMKAIGFCGWALLNGAVATTGNNVDNVTIHKVMSASDANESSSPVTHLQAESDSTSVYISAIIMTGTTTFAVYSLDLVFYI